LMSKTLRSNTWAWLAPPTWRLTLIRRVTIHVQSVTGRTARLCDAEEKMNPRWTLLLENFDVNDRSLHRGTFEGITMVLAPDSRVDWPLLGRVVHNACLRPDR